MKKIKAMILAVSLITTSLFSTGISSAADEALILTRDDSGNVVLTTSSSNTDEIPDLFRQNAFGVCTGLSVGEHGEVNYRGAFWAEGISSTSTVYFITDSNGFDKTWLERPWIRAITDTWTKLTEITTDNIEDVFYNEYLEMYDEGYMDRYKQFHAAILEKYGADVRVYRFFYGSTIVAEGEQWIRETMLQHDGILDVVGKKVDITGKAYWNGKFSFFINPDYEGIYTGEDGKEYIDIPESLENAIEEQKDVFEAWNLAYQAWMGSIDANSMTPAQLELSRKEAGIASDYEMMQIANNAYAEIIEKYSDVIQSGEPQYSFREFEQTASPVSIWESVGDIDEDGRVSAADAALLLQAAAAQGTGDTSESLSSKADVNADYSCNASDAALILSYAAQHGTGSNIHFGEFMKSVD